MSKAKTDPGLVDSATTSNAEIERRLELITRHTEEVLTVDELRALLRRDISIRHYIGFEISGKIHLGTGISCMAKIRDLLEAGVRCTVFLADWHTWINDKLGGDREVIRQVGLEYFAEGLRACLDALGAPSENVHFVLGTDLYHHNDAFWETVVDISKHTSLARMQRSITILGRQEGEAIDFAKLLYPAMQAADVFAFGAHIAHAGMDQRKAHVIARDAALHLHSNPLRDGDGKVIKPIALHHPLLFGLRKPSIWPVPENDWQQLAASMKMSKSDPDSAIFIHDSPEEIQRKIRKAFCPPEEVKFNPVLNWAQRLVFEAARQPLAVTRTPENGGSITFSAYADVEKAFLDGSLHPMDLKNAVANSLVKILEPVRARFAETKLNEALVNINNLTGKGGVK